MPERKRNKGLFFPYPSDRIENPGIEAKIKESFFPENPGKSEKPEKSKEWPEYPAIPDTPASLKSVSRKNVFPVNVFPAIELRTYLNQTRRRRFYE